jgi:fructose-bisphosphate aldolase class 1
VAVALAPGPGVLAAGVADAAQPKRLRAVAIGSNGMSANRVARTRLMENLQ